MDFNYCGFCLTSKGNRYNIDRTLEAQVGANQYTCRVMDLMASLLGIGQDLPKTACRSCIRTIVQLQCFTIQSLEAIQMLKKTQTDHFGEFSAIKKEINTKRILWEKTLLTEENVQLESAVEESLDTPKIIIIDPPETLKNNPRKRPARSKPQKASTRKQSKDTIIATSEKVPTPVPQYSAEDILKRPCLCTLCGFRFVRNDYLVVHMRRHKGEKPFKCKYCDKAFTRTTDLNVHERYHTNQRTHFCSICNKGFYRPVNLEVHMRVHTKERPYKCPECPKSYGQSNDLKTHFRSKHTAERSSCDICGEAFLLKHQLTKHKKTVHNLEVVSNNGRLAKFEGDNSN